MNSEKCLATIHRVIRPGSHVPLDEEFKNFMLDPLDKDVILSVLFPEYQGVGVEDVWQHRFNMRAEVTTVEDVLNRYLFMNI